MNKEIIKKLRYLPKKELLRIVNKVYISKEFKLHKIEEVFKKKPREVSKFLSNLPEDKLVTLLSAADDLPEDTIKNLYSEYLNGANPSIYLAEIIKDFDFKKLKLNFQNITDELEGFWKGKESQFKNFSKYDFKKIGSVYELTVSYDRRIDYAHSIEKIPKSVYDNRNFTVWLSEDNKAFITNTKDWLLVSPIKRAFEKVFSTEIVRFKLDQKLVDDIFGEESLIRGNFSTATPAQGKVPNKVLCSENLLQIDEGREANDQYDRKSSFNKVDIHGNRCGAHINQYGRISINRKLKQSDLRVWIISIITRVINEINRLKQKDIRKYFGSINLSEYKPLAQIRTNDGKEAVTILISALLQLKNIKQEYMDIPLPIRSLYRDLKEYMQFIFVPTCHCNNYCVCKGCKNRMFAFSGREMEITCAHCGEKITNMTSVECVEGHRIKGNLIDSVVAIPTEDGRTLINNLFLSLGEKLRLESHEYIQIKHNSIRIRTSRRKVVYEPDEFSEFSKLTQFKDIPQNVLKTQIQNLREEVTEKCKQHGDSNCRDCVMLPKGLCIRRLMAYFVKNPMIHAHSPTEFGDMGYMLRVSGVNTDIVGLCKSYVKKKDDKLTLKNSEGSSLISQIVADCLDARKNFLSVITGAHVDAGLRSAIIQVVGSFGKRVMFIGPEHLVRMLYTYYKNDWDQKVVVTASS